jgi:CspA family cold shock protein
MTTGVVKWFNTDKGYGFIGPDGGERDVFVHITAVQRTGLRALSEGQPLTFDVEMRSGRVAATNLNCLPMQIDEGVAVAGSGSPRG